MFEIPPGPQGPASGVILNPFISLHSKTNIVTFLLGHDLTPMYLEDKVTVLRNTVYSSSSLFHQSVHCPSVVQLVSCENFPSIADNGQSWVSFFSFLLCVCVYWIWICLYGCVHVCMPCAFVCTCMWIQTLRRRVPSSITLSLTVLR